ncbi:MAG TPA: SprT family zinc-dependent metalloprotease [Candidatus Limnocylindrales bacterium]|nr:SprT family zinc-dependent metalloprotease [Candidatus Limnocylindrales bacterium]
MTSEAPAIAELPGGPLSYTLRRSSRARVLRVVIHPDRGVVVTVPARSVRPEHEHRAAAFLAEREPWLRKHLGLQAEVARRIAARGGAQDGGSIPFRGRLHRIRVVPAVSGIRRSDVVAFDDELVIHRVRAERRSDAAILEAWLRDEARRLIDASIADHGGALGVAPKAVTIRDPRTRWGSASRTGRLSFSWRLALAPPEALETVVIHELAHLRVFGHGSRFWALVASRRPDHRVWRRWLHDHSTDLHHALRVG